ncbi:DUF759 family protein [Borrelia hermsii]|uniref:Cytosolic protein n=1 Tax=Borrelia hermsii HS1 TaxID=1867252 RepID=A0ABM6AR96_BORHE|nr:DUF759 family protein [Borrelia hermsii]ANA43814.1 hypothetical protein AXX13_P10 [Borrelia hermsii HS1]UPA08225.1 DUF759 family protein [Borrelia hermsii DAH]
MNTPKFTIKFTGVLDHASTRKSLEKDISKLEHLIKPKKSSLKSTKDILKHNLSEKKRELAKQTKYEKLRERVEKFRFTETKKLVKLGYKFEEARKKAFKRSLMSSKDRRRLEYEEMKSGKHKETILHKAIQKSILKGGSILKIATGTALGHIVGHTFQSGIGDILNFAKKSILNDARFQKLDLITSRVFKTNEKSKLDSMLQGIPGFGNSIEREDFLNSAGTLRKVLQHLGQNNDDNLKQAVAFAAKLKSTGVVGDKNSAITAVAEFLQGKSGSLYNIMSSFNKFTDKYNERAEMEYDRVATGYTFDYRTDKLKEIIKDWNSLEFPTYASEAEKIKDSLDKAQDSFGKLSASVFQPMLEKIETIAKWLTGFTVKTHIVEPIIDGIKSFFGDINEWLIKLGNQILKLTLPNWAYKWLFGSKPTTDKSHSPLLSTDTESKLETDASIRTP